MKCPIARETLIVLTILAYLIGLSIGAVCENMSERQRIQAILEHQRP